MREAVIVSTARTPIGKAYRGGFNNLASPTLAGHAISAAVEDSFRRQGVIESKTFVERAIPRANAPIRKPTDGVAVEMSKRVAQVVLLEHDPESLALLRRRPRALLNMRRTDVPNIRIQM